MSHSKNAGQISAQVLEQACDWFIDFNEGELDASGCQRFNRWLRQSPDHVRAYLEIAATWQDASMLAGARGSEDATVVDQILSATNVVPLRARTPSTAESAARAAAASQDSRPTARPRASSTRAKLPWLLAAAACVLAGVGVALLNGGDLYATGAGELRSVMLKDGSAIELDTRTKVKVRFSSHERLVELIGGQALFLVKKDAARPFVVLSNGARVRAVGTQFDVYRKPAGTTITIVEGTVAVTEAGLATRATDAAPILLTTGEQLTLTPGTFPHPVRADLETATAWTRRKLIFAETPLSDAIAEINRYNTRQIIIEDPSLSEYHIRGRFDAGDPSRLLQFLRERFNADVREHGNEIRVSRR